MDLSFEQLERIKGGNSSLEELEKQKKFLESLKPNNSNSNVTEPTEDVELDNEYLRTITAGRTF